MQIIWFSMINKLIFPTLVVTTMLTACGGGSGGGNNNSTNVTNSGFTLPRESNVITNYNIDGAFNTVFPRNYQIAKDAGFDYFIKIPLRSDPSISITILATKGSDEDLRQAIGVWTSLLSNNGANTELSKVDIFKTISQRQGTLLMASSEGDLGTIQQELLRLLKVREPKMASATEDNFLQKIASDNYLFKKYGWFVHSQALGYNETTYVGEPEYFSGYNSKTGAGSRDASIEEILHITQAQGVAPLTGEGDKGGLQKRITEHSLSIFKDYKYDNVSGLYVYDDKDTTKDYVAGSSIWSPQADGATLDEKREEQWDGDWGGDDIGKNLGLPEQYKMGQTFSHEYFAALADTYYGMYGGFNTEFGGMDNYRYVTRETLPSDGEGFAMVKEFLPEYHQYTARIDSGKVNQYLKGHPSLNNTFKIQFSSNSDEKYTFKSQYIKNLKVIGSEPLIVLGNAQDNYFEGNSSNNSFDGSDGIDVLKVNGNKGDYLIEKLAGGVTQISGNSNGTDKITNVEYIKFNDDIVKVDNI
ncbi:putative lipoprotein [Vibrio chagasii]|nr:putative lipoprotein [Vibrio chagasii]CAH7249902.1 putative lipoprotein [Vibrio chagasii]